MKYILDRLSEPSTWRGIISVLTALGVKLRPDLTDAIVSAGLGAMGVINVVRKEKPDAPSTAPSA
jgi:hypothetical protein